MRCWIGLIFLLITVSSRSEDSLIINNINKLQLSGFYTFSFDINKRNSLNEIKSWSFLLNQTINYRKEKNNKEFRLELRADLSYVKYIDSIWIKSNDAFLLNYSILKISNKKSKTTFNLNVRSSIADEWLYKKSGNNYLKTWRNGPMTPGCIILSYGKNINIRKKSNLLLGIGGLEIKTFNTGQPSNDSAFIKWGNVGIDLSYGLNLGITINEQFSKFIALENRSVFFLKKPEKPEWNMDLQSRLWISIYKSLRLKIENKIYFESKDPSSLKTRNEFLLGVFIK